MAYKRKFENPTKKDLKVRICDVVTGEVYMDADLTYLMFASGRCEDFLHEKMDSFINYIRFHPNAELKVTVYNHQEPESIKFPDVY